MPSKAKTSETLALSIEDDVLRVLINEALKSYIPEIEIIAGEDEERKVCVTVTDSDRHKKSGQATIRLTKSKDETSDRSDKDVLLLPVRMGILLERVRYHINSLAENEANEVIKIGPYRLMRENGTLTEVNEGEDLARLTEKECHILHILNGEDGKAIDRKSLLESVWGYAEGVETHTLETHIYRLRQKIEKNPAEPQILLTDDTGYKICV